MANLGGTPDSSSVAGRQNHLFRIEPDLERQRATWVLLPDRLNEEALQARLEALLAAQKAPSEEAGARVAFRSARLTRRRWRVDLGVYGTAVGAGLVLIPGAAVVGIPIAAIAAAITAYEHYAARRESDREAEESLRCAYWVAELELNRVTEEIDRRTGATGQP